MTHIEAINLVELWIQHHSPLQAEVLNTTSTVGGTREVLVNCSGFYWKHIVHCNGRVSGPVWLDSQDSQTPNTEQLLNAMPLD